jgi:pimeloyl-ACP methyl ester carboxylesterase
MSCRKGTFWGAVILGVLMGQASAEAREKVMVKSSLDGTEQPCYVLLPDGFDPAGPSRPLLVSLHTWSNDVEQRFEALENLASRRGWIYLFPHFRGPNASPDACGSPKAQQDILDAVDWAIARFPVDRQRIYLTGASGGGHMAMLMAARHPRRWTAVSAWVGISDLAAWHERHAADNYGKMLRQSCGGAPGQGPEVDEQYRLRSPLTWLAGAVDVPLDLAAGVHDGYTGSVPVRHTLEAFNGVAREQGAAVVSKEEIVQISRPDGRLDRPQPCDTQDDPTYGRAIYLRRTAGKCRVTIFEGGHERCDEAALEWLSQQVKPLSGE